MKIRVHVYGTLRKLFSEYDVDKGLEVETSNEATISDLISHLEIPINRVGVVSVNGDLVGKSHQLQSEDLVHVFQPIFGG